MSRLRNGQKYLATVPKKARSIGLWKCVWVQVFIGREQSSKVNRTEVAIRKSMPAMKSRVDEICTQSQLIGKPAQAGAEIQTRKEPSPRALAFPFSYDRGSFSCSSRLQIGSGFQDNRFSGLL